jgi:hypothetical protein
MVIIFDKLIPQSFSSSPSGQCLTPSQINLKGKQKVRGHFTVIAGHSKSSKIKGKKAKCQVKRFYISIVNIEYSFNLS